MTKYALVSNAEMEILDASPTPGEERGMITVPADTIVNIIMYNGTDPYTPPAGTRLEEVPDDAKIGDLI